MRLDRKLFVSLQEIPHRGSLCLCRGIDNFRFVFFKNNWFKCGLSDEMMCVWSIMWFA